MTAVSYVPLGIIALTLIALVWMIRYKRRSQREDPNR